MRDRTLDTLIIGQGLAGSALAWHLIALGERVCVIDDGHRSAASMVAAGLINPLAGMRFNRRPEMDDWLRAADDWYAELEKHFGRRFYHPLPMLRLFRSAEQRRFLERRRQDPASRTLLGEAFTADDCPAPVAAPYGGFLQLRTGYVDLPLLLATLRDWLDTQGAIETAALTFDAITLHDGPGHAISVAGRHARRLVFCDGARLRHNPWFRYLPLAPDQGEILDLQLVDWRPDHIVNGTHWLLPLTDGSVRFGATHEHKALSGRPTDVGKSHLLTGFADLRPDTALPKVTAHRAGIRPATADRYPLLGQHPRHPALWVCNGFGARGALTVPWYALALARHLRTAAPLPHEADIRRCPNTAH